MTDPDDAIETAIRSASSAKPVSSFVLRVIKGPSAGAAYGVDRTAPPILVGTGPACTAQVVDPMVSRRHLSAEADWGALRITDQQSTNGTWLNGRRVVEAFAQVGDSIGIGDTTLHVEAKEAAKSPLTSSRTSFGAYLGASDAMRALYPLIERIAASSVPTLIEGETGTGKEVLAEAIHELGPRRQGRFVVFDCTAVAPNLMEAELFGHEKGAFTGAAVARVGLVESADGGTLLIDEIGDLDLSLQPKLLRLIDRGEVRRVGGLESRRVDVRFLAATRRNLDAEVTAGRFRDDLFHRLVVGRVELPPLSRRRGDVALLARHFAETLGLAADALPATLIAQWEAHQWPGNLRELRGAVARYAALGETHPVRSAGELTVIDGQLHDLFFEDALAMGLSLYETRRVVSDELERRYIARMLERSGGNVSRAAEMAGIARRNFQILRSKPRR